MTCGLVYDEEYIPMDTIGVPAVGGYASQEDRVSDLYRIILYKLIIMFF